MLVENRLTGDKQALIIGVIVHFPAISLFSNYSQQVYTQKGICG
jgi:hypothetical protein